MASGLSPYLELPRNLYGTSSKNRATLEKHEKALSLYTHSIALQRPASQQQTEYSAAAHAKVTRPSRRGLLGGSAPPPVHRAPPPRPDAAFTASQSKKPGWDTRPAPPMPPGRPLSASEAPTAVKAQGQAIAYVQAQQAALSHSGHAPTGGGGYPSPALVAAQQDAVARAREAAREHKRLADHREGTQRALLERLLRSEKRYEWQQRQLQRVSTQLAHVRSRLATVASERDAALDAARISAEESAQLRLELEAMHAQLHGQPMPRHAALGGLAGRHGQDGHGGSVSLLSAGGMGSGALLRSDASGGGWEGTGSEADSSALAASMFTLSENLAQAEAALGAGGAASTAGGGDGGARPAPLPLLGVASGDGEEDGAASASVASVHGSTTKAHRVAPPLPPADADQQLGSVAGSAAGGGSAAADVSDAPAAGSGAAGAPASPEALEGASNYSTKIGVADGGQYRLKIISDGAGNGADGADASAGSGDVAGGATGDGAEAETDGWAGSESATADDPASTAPIRRTDCEIDRTADGKYQVRLSRSASSAASDKATPRDDDGANGEPYRTNGVPLRKQERSPPPLPSSDGLEGAAHDVEQQAAASRLQAARRGQQARREVRTRASAPPATSMLGQSASAVPALPSTPSRPATVGDIFRRYSGGEGAHSGSERVLPTTSCVPRTELEPAPARHTPPRPSLLPVSTPRKSTSPAAIASTLTATAGAIARRLRSALEEVGLDLSQPAIAAALEKGEARRHCRGLRRDSAAPAGSCVVGSSLLRRGRMLSWPRAVAHARASTPVRVLSRHAAPPHPHPMFSRHVLSLAPQSWRTPPWESRSLRYASASSRGTSRVWPQLPRSPPLPPAPAATATSRRCGIVPLRRCSRPRTHPRYRCRHRYRWVAAAASPIRSRRWGVREDGNGTRRCARLRRPPRALLRQTQQRRRRRLCSIHSLAVRRRRRRASATPSAACESAF